MAEWGDVVDARNVADAALVGITEMTRGLGPIAQDVPAALATLAAARAICLELRALGTMLDYASRAE